MNLCLQGFAVGAIRPYGCTRIRLRGDPMDTNLIQYTTIGVFLHCGDLLLLGSNIIQNPLIANDSQGPFSLRVYGYLLGYPYWNAS